MNKFILIGLLLSSSILAESFFIKDKVYEFVDFEGVLISQCQNNCLAKKVIIKNKKIVQSELKSDSFFSNSLGSEVCKKIFKGFSLLGQAHNQDRRAFCVFKDQSLIEINSLTDYLKQKNIVK